MRLSINFIRTGVKVTIDSTLGRAGRSYAPFPFIKLGSKSFTALKEHEYGHCLQWRQLGVLAIFPAAGSITTTTLLSNGCITSKTHMSMPWEIDANKRAAEYYGPKSDIATKQWYIKKQSWE